MNKVLLKGFVGREPRFFSNGSGACFFTLATSESYKKGSEWVKSTEWHQCKAFGKIATVCADQLKKGLKIFVEGSIRTDNKEGEKKFILVSEISVLSAPKEEFAGDTRPDPIPSEQPSGSMEDDFGDDVPF